MVSDSDSSEPSFFEKVEKKLRKWIRRSETKVDHVTIASSTKFEDLFPFETDTPEERENKFLILSRIWKPKSDLYALTLSPWFSLFISGFSLTPFLRLVRTSLKVTRFNPVIAVSTTVALAAGSSFIIMTNQLDKIVRGEVGCAECHLVRTGAYQLLCATLVPSMNVLFSSFFSVIHNPGIPIPIDTFKNWASFKEALRIAGQALSLKKMVAMFLVISVVNVALGVGLVYCAMKQYHDVHARLLVEASNNSRSFI